MATEGQLTWTEFKICCRNFLQLSEKSDDNWKFLKKNGEEINLEDNDDDDNDTKYSLYLNKIIKKKVKLRKTTNETTEFIIKLLTFDYHILYSVSYGVPMLYFNIYNTDGSLLDLVDVWGIFNENNQNNCNENMFTVLTQMEHPILFKPFFALHPCKIELFLAELTESKNKVLTYLSTVGPSVCLDLNINYGQTL